LVLLPWWLHPVKYRTSDLIGKQEDQLMFIKHFEDEKACA
jgi:hypothetical protein